MTTIVKEKINMLNLLLKLLQLRAFKRPYFDIYHGTSLYMRRWWLRGDDKAREDGKVTIGLHHICRPDLDRDMHTHPCSFLSFIVKGWYVEKTPSSQSQAVMLDQENFKVRRRGAGSFAFRQADDRHLIQSISDGGVWTVIVWFKKQGSWGFWTQAGFVNHRDYKPGQQ